MSQAQYKTILSLVLLGMGVYVFVFEPQVIQGLARTGFRFGAVAGALLIGFLAISTFMSALRGVNDAHSAPVENPGSFGNRFAGLFLASIFGALALLLVYWALFRFPA